MCAVGTDRRCERSFRGQPSKGRSTTPAVARIGLLIVVAALVAVAAASPIAAAADDGSAPVTDGVQGNETGETGTNESGDDGDANESSGDSAPASEDGSGADESSDDDSDSATVERSDDAVVAEVPADRIDDGEIARVTVTLADLDARVETNASRRGDRYVASIPVTDLVPPETNRSLDAERVRVAHGGAVVADATVDLRYASVGGARFEGTSLVLDADLRGLGAETVTFELRGGAFDPSNGTLRAEGRRYRVPNGTVNASVEGAGPNATLAIPPGELAGLDPTATYEAIPTVGGDPLPADRIDLGIAEPAADATGYRYVGGDRALAQPLVHPAFGPATVRIETTGPDGSYAVRATDERGIVPVPASVLAAEGASVTVTVGGAVVVDGVTPSSPPTETVPLRIEDGRLHAPDPDALAPYDAVVVRADGLYRVPIDEGLREGESRALDPELAAIGSADAILVGADARPAAADLTVIGPEGGGEATTEETPEPTDPAEPDAAEFVGLWVEVGAGVALLLIAMVGGTTAVGLAFVLRLGHPASSDRTRLRAVPVHFLVGGAFGLGTIALLQTSPWWDPSLGTTTVLGVEVGTGALLVGGVHGGLTATGLRVGLGAGGRWPTARNAPDAVPVRVTVTDDEGDPVEGEQTVVAQRPAGSIGAKTTVSGSTTELDLAPGEWEVTARIGARESDPARIRLPEPTTRRPEPRTTRVTIRRPRLLVSVSDAVTGDDLDGATVAVTTDRNRTSSRETEDGVARFPLPMATEAVSVAARAEGYDEGRVERRIEHVDAAADLELSPSSGTLRARALIDDEPVPGARLPIEPGGSDPPDAGRPDPSVETDEAGVGETELPVGTYRVRLSLDGPNANLYDARDAVVAVEADATAETTVRGRFNWALAEADRERIASLRETVAAVADESATDPTVPLYFAGVATELLDATEELPDAGHRFAVTDQRPDAVAGAAVSAADATLGAVGRAMQHEEVRRVLAAADGDPDRVSPTLDVGAEDLLAHVDGGVTGSTLDERVAAVADRVDAEATTLDSVAPARATVEAAKTVPAGADAPVERALREYAALRLLDAVEELFEREPLRRRLQ